MNNNITEFLENRFVSDVGFSKCEDTPFFGLENAVSMVFRLSDAVVEQIDKAPTHTYFQHYRTMNTYIDSVAHQLVMYLQQQGITRRQFQRVSQLRDCRDYFPTKKRLFVQE